MGREEEQENTTKPTGDKVRREPCMERAVICRKRCKVGQWVCWGEQQALGA
jgi:hypothetical protein